MQYSINVLAAHFPEPATPDASDEEWNRTWNDVETNYYQTTEFATLDEARGAALLILETCYPKIISNVTVRRGDKILLMSNDTVLIAY